ncbi:MAG: class I SAM-dependent methyltransferase [Alphaproteobacteria bacterium]
MTCEDYGETSDLEVIDRLVALSGLDLVDVGCGAGALTRALAQRGARVLGIEPDPGQAARFRAGDETAGVSFAESGGETLPLADSSVDGVFFAHSLHHVPIALMNTALDEALRVLRSETGFLYVIEPVMAGSYGELVRSFNDESEVQRQAREALEHRVAPRFREAREIHYRSPVVYADFETFLAEKLGQTYNDHRRERIDTPEVRARFAAGWAGNAYRFEQPTRVNYYRAPIPSISFSA